MVYIDTSTSLENFRKFIIISTCNSFIPRSYFDDYQIFPERNDDLGSVYVEAADKVTLKKMREIIFVNAIDVLGVIYNSKSGNTNLKWRQIRKYHGKLTGDASQNSLVNLSECKIITLDWVSKYIKNKVKSNT